jgi:hypothetical protein
MKTLLLLCTLICAANTLLAQTKFYGDWSVTSPKDTATDIIRNRLTVEKDSSSFEVIDNQLVLDCKNKFQGDTLLLYVLMSDCGRLFYGTQYHPPKRNSLFAKCYLDNNTMHIIYTQKLFKDHIKDFELCTVLYKY